MRTEYDLMKAVNPNDINTLVKILGLDNYEQGLQLIKGIFDAKDHEKLDAFFASRQSSDRLSIEHGLLLTKWSTTKTLNKM